MSIIRGLTCPSVSLSHTHRYVRRPEHAENVQSVKTQLCVTTARFPETTPRKRAHTHTHLFLTILVNTATNVMPHLTLTVTLTSVTKSHMSDHMRNTSMFLSCVPPVKRISRMRPYHTDTMSESVCRPQADEMILVECVCDKRVVCAEYFLLHHHNLTHSVLSVFVCLSLCLSVLSF